VRLEFGDGALRRNRRTILVPLARTHGKAPGGKLPVLYLEVTADPPAFRSLWGES
jgi:hypothetical protein